MGLSAVTNGKVYGLLPYNWYTQNFGSILANAWFIGKNLYPDRFMDIVPEQKADEIYSFLVAAPVFTQMNNSFRHMAFQAVDLK
jgi:iron complex transport system substrate-binding protein